MASIEGLLKEICEKLVTTSTRNRLIHVNRSATRGNLLNIINERSDAIFKILRSESKKMRFSGKGQEEDGNPSEGITLALIEDKEFNATHHTDRILETPLTPDALQKRLLRLAKDARAVEEEQGINTIFLAIGFLRWYEDEKSNILRESPLILLPVELIRNNKNSTYNIQCRDDDIDTNRPLQERLQGDFGTSLPEIDDTQEWIPSEYFTAVRDSISNKERWSVDPDGMQLGFFSFAKLLMIRDLDPANWEGKSLLLNKLIGGLLAKGFKALPPLFDKDAKLDAVLPPENILHVVDADASQTKVIEEVRADRNLVVRGPPGTGKSQTITNILAAAAHEGKKVLFVAEKMAALDVVYNRMRKAGLKDLCLELHSRSANKKKFLQELQATVSHGHKSQLSEFDTAELKNVRDELNQISELLHNAIPERDYSPYKVLSVLVEFHDTRAPRFNASALEPIKSAEEERLFGCLENYLNIIRKHGHGRDNPFYGATNLDLQPTDLQRLVEDLTDALNQLSGWTELQRGLEEVLNSAPTLTLSSASLCKSILLRLRKAPEETPQLVSSAHANIANTRFSDALSIGLKWVQHKESLDSVVLDSVWAQDLNQLKLPIVKGVGSWLYRIFGKYRSASNELGSFLKNEIPKNPAERLKILESIIEGRAKKKAMDHKAELLKKYLSDALCKIGNTLGMEYFSGEEKENAPIPKLDRLINAMLVKPKEKYHIWTQFQQAKENLLEFRGVNQLVKMIDGEDVTIESAKAEIKYALYETRWNYALEALPELKKLRGLNRHRLVRIFSELEKRRVTEVKKLIIDKHLRQIPQGSEGPMGLLRGEFAKKRRHRPIRRLMERAAEVIQRIKPIFLMSPISVAQFLPPGKVEFDLLVIDEASQVRPEDALGSIARVKQIVVVGDQKQLPPTSFFDRITGNSDSPDDEEDEGEDEIIATRATEMESVLSLCVARGLNESMLEWHYRSRDPSLIAVSNKEFYEGRLILPPCPTQADKSFGLKLVQVPGVYSSRNKGKGRTATNRIEAECVVDRLRELASSRPVFSVGIVTFSKSQADMVTEVLEFRRRGDSILDAFLREDKNEDVFVKNIENVQGDERDIILISVGYGPYEPNGRLPSMNFGPINKEGGERRLNVLFTRSRSACEVFTSFDPKDINLSRTSMEGPAILKKFLECAKSGILTETYTSSGGADSPFEEEVANEIRTLGYEVVHQVGEAGFKIDLGVKDPDNHNHFILAVECDGATYHSALWARERDRLRQEVLEYFGWRFHRIWGTDWFHNRAPEVQRLKAALESAKGRDVSDAIVGANAASKTIQSPPPKVVVSEPIALEKNDINVPKYTKADIDISSNAEPHELPIPQVRQAVEAIVTIEGPVHVELIARRYAEGSGKTRTGQRIKKRVVEGLYYSKRAGNLLRSGNFWGTQNQFQNVPVRDRSLESSPTTNAEYLPPEEIRACAKLIENECGKIEGEELIRVIVKTLGFKRTGSDLQEVVKNALSQ